MKDLGLAKKILGSLTYEMISSRPDLAHSMSVINRFMSNPGKTHWKTSKLVMRYIKSSVNKGLLYSKSDDSVDTIVGYVDSDYAIDSDRRRSLTLYVFILFGNTISWKSTLQSVVTLSSTEVEYMALADVTKESVWLKG
ncbi:secreted RxLR effector protein 161-like [Benincasa hispida]|uniref:secreted RxLR effector protein 161-like n=1 Tax=Benincasa hispida TaxID=102211 RepID=UPI001901CFA4|nr:secreted RxLR effector protein 161-like [Benincasa hispida]